MPVKLRLLFSTLFLISLLSGGCARVQFGAEFDQQADFSGYQSYAWVTDELVLIGSGMGDPRIRNEDNERRIRAEVDAALAAKGLAKVDRDDADLIVAFVVGTREQLRLEGGGSTYSLLTSKDAASTYYQGSLSIDLFDAASRQQVWHGWVSKPLEADTDPDEIIKRAVARILAQFPPGSSAR
jgi:hypothetical protein